MILLINIYYIILLSQAKLEAQATESFVSISNLQAERDELLSYKEYYNKLTRELEQQNDDLERAKRYYYIDFCVLFNTLATTYCCAM